MAGLRRKRGRGRPPAPRGTKRSRNVTVWLTDTEHAARAAAAERDGQPLSDWMRSASELALERAQEVHDDAAQRRAGEALADAVEDA